MVFIYGGTNDMFSQINIGDAINNIQRMVNLVNEQGGKAYVFKGYDAESVLNSDKLTPTKYCDKKCMLKSRQRMIDFQKDLSSISNAIIIPTVVGDSNWTSDGIHPSGSKHQIMKDFVENYLSKSPTSSSKNEKLNTLSPENIAMIHGFLQLLGYSKPEWGISKIISPEFLKALNNFKFDQGLESSEIFGHEELDLLKGKLRRENIDLSDLDKVSLQKTKSVDTTSSNFSTNIDSSVLDKFKKVLANNNLSYNDFVSKVKSIGLAPEIAVKQLYAESGFRPEVINCSRKSSAGAKGIAQFIDSSWSTYGGSGSPCNVSDSLNAYVKLMDTLLKKFPNRVDLALAGYNWGPYRATLKQALNQNISFEELKSKLPTETKNYVSKILES